MRSLRWDWLVEMEPDDQPSVGREFKFVWEYVI